MASKKDKNKKISKQSSIDIEAIGLIILALGIFLFGLLIPAVPTGQMGQNFRDNVGGAMGWAMVMLPWPLIVTGILFITRNNPSFLTRILIGYSLVITGAWLFSSLIIPEISGRWGYGLRQLIFGAIGWFGYLLALFIVSLGIDLFLNWKPASFASSVLRSCAKYLEGLFKNLLKMRSRAKEKANFHADVVLVQNDLKMLEKDLLALSIMHSSQQETSRLEQWRKAIEELRKGLNHPNEELLQEAYHSMMGWCESLQTMSNDSAKMLLEAIKDEQVNNFDHTVLDVQHLLEHPFKGKTLTTVALENLRQKSIQHLGQIQGQYKALLKLKDNAKVVLENDLSSQEKGKYTLRSISDQDLQETNVFWNEGGVSPKMLAKTFESHKTRLGKLETLSLDLKEVSEHTRNLNPWFNFSGRLEHLSEEITTILPKQGAKESTQTNPIFKESFTEFDGNLRNEIRDEGEDILVAERLVYWQERFIELNTSLKEASSVVENLSEESTSQAPVKQIEENIFDWRNAPQQVEFKDLNPEDTLEQVPESLLEATLNPPTHKNRIEVESKSESAQNSFIPEDSEDSEDSEDKNSEDDHSEDYDTEDEDSEDKDNEAELTEDEDLELPQLEFLQETVKAESMPSSLSLRAQIIDNTIESFKLKGKVQLETSKRGPTVTRFEIRPGEGEKISRYASLSDDIALAMGVASVRIEAPIQGKKDIIGLEVPNEKRDVVYFRESVEAREFQTIKEEASILPIVLGKSIEGDFLVANLTKMPHLLIAGSTGSGKSVAVNVLINSLLYCFLATELRFLMIDPKMVELTPYDGIPHLLRPVVTNPNDAAGVLLGAVSHMERRYKMMSKIGAKSLEQYNKKAKELDMPQMPFIVIIIDELADLMITSPKEVESAIMRLAQMARATGMHLILATQRPSVDILTSLIKVNIPARMAFAVSSSHDSRTILDTAGAERLTGMGDMLFYQPGLVKPVRLQCPLLNEPEIVSVSDFLRKQTPFFDDEFVEAYGSDFDSVSGDESEASGLIDWKDSKLREAAELVINEGQASVSRLQRRLQVGHARAGKLMDSLEALAIVGPHQGSKPREVLVGLEELPNVFGS